MQVKHLFITLTVLFGLLLPSFAQNTSPEHIVKLFYVIPKDQKPLPDIDATINEVIKNTQLAFAELMENHGFKRKTFIYETDADGDAVVHHINGAVSHASFYDKFAAAIEEIYGEYSPSVDEMRAIIDKHPNTINLIMFDYDGPPSLCGEAGRLDRVAFVKLSDGCFNHNVMAHELAHIFGLWHHHIVDDVLIENSYTSDRMLRSFCSAEWLDISRYFNPDPKNSTGPTTTQMLPPLAAPPNAVRLRFEVADPDGLYMAQLVVAAAGGGDVIACKRLHGEKAIVEFETTYLSQILDGGSVTIWVVDETGELVDYHSNTFLIDITPVMPSPKVVRVLDHNLAAAIREQLGLASKHRITSYDMSKLTNFTAINRQIKNLTGLEHAVDLHTLNVIDNQIEDITPLLKLPLLHTLSLRANQIRDLTPFKALTNLETLGVGNNPIRDLTPLTSLPKLRQLSIGTNQANKMPLISDIDPIAEMTQLRVLNIVGFREGLDISPLTKLTGLELLNLGYNNISDITLLSGLVNLKNLFLWGNQISDVSPLVGLTHLRKLHLEGNPLSYSSIHTHIPTMQAKGIEVKFNNRAHPALLKISGDRQEGTAGEALPKPFVVEAMDAMGKSMKGVPVTFSFIHRDRTLGTKTAKTNAKGRARTTLTFGQTPGKHTVRVSAKGIRSSVIFTATATGPPIYWVDKNSGTLHRSIGSKVENLVPSVQNATSLAVDAANNKLYWTEQTSNKTGRIRRANLDGSNVQPVKSLTSLPQGLAVDPGNRKLYLTNAWGKIQRLNLDGSSFEPNLVRGLDAPKNVVLDTAGGKLYWMEQTSNTTGKIQRANLDGSNVQPVKSLNSVPRGLAIDTVNGKLYLTSSWRKIQRLNVDGLNFEPNLITDLDSPESITVDVARRTLYWTEAGNIRVADINGENIQDVVAGLGAPASIVLGVTAVGAAISAAPAVLTPLPEATSLLPNYPNPFNPETWIPYQLAKPAEGTLHIYSVNGALVRKLVFGHQPAGIYQQRSRAAYWDGRNSQGEKVASGIYFYTITAGDFTATRKMLIRK